MPRPSRAIHAYKTTKIPAKCKKHPNQDAVKDGLCASCLAYRELSKKVNGTPAKAAATK